MSCVRVSWRMVIVSPSVRVSVMVPPLAEVFVVVVPANMLASAFAASLFASRFMVFMGCVSFSALVCGFIVARRRVCCLSA